jgi:hypothetical protein
MQRELSNLALRSEMMAPTKLVTSRRGCSTEVLEVSTDESALRCVQVLLGMDPNYQKRMTMINNKVMQIEIQSQLMEIALLAQDRSQFARSAEHLSILAEAVPSRSLMRSAICAHLISSATSDDRLAELVEEISSAIRQLKSELGAA